MNEQTAIDEEPTVSTAKSSLSPCYRSTILLERSHAICLCVVYGRFHTKRAELSVGIETVWLTVLTIFIVWPFNRKSLMAPAQGLRQARNKYTLGSVIVAQW